VSYSVIVRPEAEEDVESAYRWYQRKSRDRGTYFLRVVRALLGTIERNPGIYPKVYQDVHRALLRGFPYAIYYVEEGDVIHVVACTHTRRHPRRWRSRI
jgi:plasmid stabilization system protein ParE